MIQLTVLYGHYQEKHAPLARTFPGLKGYTITKTTSLAPQEQSPYYLMAILYFENREALQTALQSPAGQAAAADLQTFASGGATLLVGEVEVFDAVSLS
jgi:uncharacterized protein (TIGR02118 family)